MARLATKVKPDVNVVVCIKEESGKYTWRIAKAVGKPRPAKAGERDHDGVSFGASKSKEVLVVDVHQYDVIKRNLSEYGTYGEAVAAFRMILSLLLSAFGTQWECARRSGIYVGLLWVA